LTRTTLEAIPAVKLVAKNLVSTSTLVYSVWYIELNTNEPPERLRCGRVLAENMVITVEPGIYFIKPLLHELYNNADLTQFIVKEKLDLFHEFGGVRIESDVVITATGVENMTDVPRTVDEIEAWMKN
jgi:Xaa-Pro aminopeptidase